MTSKTAERERHSVLKVTPKNVLEKANQWLPCFGAKIVTFYFYIFWSLKIVRNFSKLKKLMKQAKVKIKSQKY